MIIKNYVTSSMKGRFRIRHPSFMDKNLTETILAFFKKQSTLKSVKVNLRTGSVLIKYESVNITEDAILSSLEEYMVDYFSENGSLKEFLQLEQKTSKKCCAFFNLNKIACRKLVNRSLLVFFVSSVGSVFLKRNYGHAFVSGIFVVLSMAHIYFYRKKI